ncbi:MAG: type II toxin-antitoxin system VapC family toxin [Candidatus Saccharimonadales bacterium]
MVVYLDTNILIYLLEDNGWRSVQVADTLDALRYKGGTFVTSVLTLTEFMAGRAAVAPETLLEISSIRFVGIDTDVAVRAGTLQRTQRLKIGDAVHVAAAEFMQADKFFTNDKELAAKLPEHIKVMTLE